MGCIFTRFPSHSRPFIDSFTWRNAVLTIVSATTHNEASFHKDTFLGTSLSRLRKAGLDFDTRIIFRNPSNVGLPEVYNRAIGNDASSQQPMVLIHDDVSIEDALVEQKLDLALSDFDIVGTAGGDPPVQALGWYNNRCWPAFGCVAHADRDQLDSVLRPAAMYYGPSPHRCRVIDGHFMALIPVKIVQANVRFDPQFTYNHYDLDFCHSAHAAGLRIGTWPIWVVHGSGGGYGTEAWKRSAERYQRKYSS